VKLELLAHDDRVVRRLDDHSRDGLVRIADATARGGESDQA
jgi:hypothetical protein